MRSQPPKKEYHRLKKPWPIYPKYSFGFWWQRIGTAIGLIGIAVTAYLAYNALPCSLDSARRLVILAVAWGVVPPFLWWIEFFFVFPKYHTPEKFELLKHGAQASLAIWAPIAVALAAYSTNDYFKVPEAPKPCFVAKTR